MKALKSKLVTLSSLFFGAMGSAHAALPDPGNIGSLDATLVGDGDAVSVVQGLFTEYGTWLALAVTVMVTIGVGWYIFSAFTEAKEKGDWKGFGVTASVGIFVSVLVGGMAFMAVGFLA